MYPGNFAVAGVQPDNFYMKYADKYYNNDFNRRGVVGTRRRLIGHRMKETIQTSIKKIKTTIIARHSNVSPRHNQNNSNFNKSLREYSLISKLLKYVVMVLKFLKFRDYLIILKSIFLGNSL